MNNVNTPKPKQNVFKKYFDSLNAIQIVAHVIVLLAIIVSSLIHVAFLIFWGFVITLVSIIVMAISVVMFLDNQ